MKILRDFLEKITPVNNEDRSEWADIKREIINSTYQIVWDASSGLDIYPILALALGKIPDFLLVRMEDAILLMSDYCPNYLSTLKEVYRNLDNRSVRVLWKSQYGFKVFGTFECNIDGNAEPPINFEVFVDQMISFKLWDDDERNRFKTTYEYHHSVTSHPVPDADWHIVYFLLRLKSDLEDLVFPLVFIGAENLLVFEHIFNKYNIPIEGFFAVRVAGKSGSWDYTHNFSHGKLPHAIAEAPLYIRPRFWGLEKSKWGDKLPQSFVKKGKISGLGYGGCTVFETHWRE